MRQQIILPWRDAGCTYRKHHFDFLHDYYSQEFDVVVGDCDGDFNRSAARNAGVNASQSEVSVIIDADNYIPYSQIYEAIELATKKDLLAKPFKTFGYLTEESTNTFFEYQGLISFDPTYIDPPQENFTGGAYVMKKSLWQRLGGMDEGFIGWGAEDDAFHLLCKKRGIKTVYASGYDYHLYHPAHRVTSQYNYNKLVKEYVRGN